MSGYLTFSFLLLREGVLRKHLNGPCITFPLWDQFVPSRRSIPIDEYTHAEKAKMPPIGEIEKNL
jgi:hypothetical protein